MKHPYATNLTERQQLPLWLAALSFACALGLGKVWLAIGWTPPSWLDVPSTIGFYGLFYSVVSRWAWKWKWLRRIGAIKTPIVAGTWKGGIRSSFDDYANGHEIEICIYQDWTEMLVTLKSASSQSHSLIGSIIVNHNVVVGYEYQNEPRQQAVDTMHMHRGTARLVLSPDCDCLEGHYYSGRDRQNCGEISLRRVE